MSKVECDICAGIEAKRLKSSKKLSEIVLQCWMRECGTRPYTHLIFHGHVFERKFDRKMTDEDFLQILDFLDMKIVQHFEFLHCMVPNIHAQLFFQCFNHLVSLNLSHSVVPPEMFQYLADNAKDVTLKTLMLCGHQIDQKQAEYLQLYLSQTEQLHNFDVSNCGLNHITLAIIADGILNCKNMKSIDLSNIVPHHPQKIMDVSKISVILSILIWSSRLLEVHYRKIGIDSSSIGMICESVGVSFLKILDIGANCIGPDGTEKIFTALRNSNVTALLMPFNKIGDAGGNAIVEHLSYTKLEHLDIGFNEISSATIEMLLTSLTRWNSIKSLNIFGNDLKSETIGNILHILTTNNILDPDGLDVAATYTNGAHRIFPVENCVINNFKEFPKLSKYCEKEKINPFTMMWFKKVSWSVVGIWNLDYEGNEIYKSKLSTYPVIAEQ